jgi:cytohesin
MKHLLLTTIAAVLVVGCGPPKPPDTSIHDAAKEGNIEALKQHIAAGTDVNAKNDNGETPLQNADNKFIAELLITNGADVNMKSRNGETPLHYAARDSHKEVAELLISKGANVNVKEDERGDTPLHKAADNGHKEVVELLIANGADVNAKNKVGWTPLHSSFNEGHREVIEPLIAAGADVNAKGGLEGSTPLHEAAWQGHKETIELLIAKGAAVNEMDEYDSTPLDEAIKFKNTETAALLRKHGGKTGEELKAEESIHIAAERGNIEAVKQHLAAGTDVNALDDDGGTPLALAIRSGNTETADLLRKHGGKHGTIHSAVDGGDVEAVKEFLAAAVDVNAKDGVGWTPLLYAAAYGHKEIAELLIENGADLNAKSENGWTPLHRAAEYGHKGIVELLIAKGADVNAKAGKWDVTPLGLTIQSIHFPFGHPEIGALLRKHGGKQGYELKAEGK